MQSRKGPRGLRQLRQLRRLFPRRKLSQAVASRRREFGIRNSEFEENVRPRRRDEHCSSVCPTCAYVGGRFVNRPYGSTPSVSGGRYTPLTPPPEGEARLLRRGRRPARGRARLSDTRAGTRATAGRPYGGNAGPQPRSAQAEGLSSRTSVATLVWRSVLLDPRTKDAGRRGRRPLRRRGMRIVTPVTSVTGSQ